MRTTLLFCLLLLMGLSIAVIVGAYSFFNAALASFNQGIASSLQTVVLEGSIALVLSLFMVVLFLCGTNLGSGTGRLLFGYGLFILSEILKNGLLLSP